MSGRFDLRPGQDTQPLVLADKEHHSHQLFESVHQARLFDLLVAVPAKKRSAADLVALARLPFTEQWPGHATAHRPHMSLALLAQAAIQQLRERLG